MATSVWKVKVLRIIGKTSPVLCTMVFAVCMHGSCFLQGERIERGIRVCCVACLRRHIWLLYACGKYVMVHCCSVVFLSILVHQLLYRYELFNVLYLDFNLVPTKMRHHFADILIVNEITTTSRQTVCVCVFLFVDYFIENYLLWFVLLDWLISRQTVSRFNAEREPLIFRTFSRNE